MTLDIDLGRLIRRGVPYVEACLQISFAAFLVHRFRFWGGIVSVIMVSALHYTRIYLAYRKGSARIVHYSADKAKQKSANLSKEEFKERQAMGDLMTKILARCPTLLKPSYFPTFWASNQWVNAVLYLVKLSIIKYFAPTKLEKHVLVMEDGGEVTVDVCSDPDIPESAPLIIILVTITGTNRDAGVFLMEAQKRGWRGCVFNRRGHTKPLKTPRFNLLGDMIDTECQVNYVRQLYPKASYIAMAGLSAGSGLLVNYLGYAGKTTPISVGCCLCPAYDISAAFKDLRENFPWGDEFIVKGMKRTFIKRNAEVLSLLCPDSLEQCSTARTLDQFLTSHVKFAGCQTFEEYDAKYNPMNWVEKVRTPFLVVNSEDDMICLPRNITEDDFRWWGSAALLRTKFGSHIAFNEGILGTGNYLARVAMDFIEAAKSLADEKKEA